MESGFRPRQLFEVVTGIRYLLATVITMLAVVFPAVAEVSDYGIVHCLADCPSGREENPLLLRPIYALSYNSLTKSADWVAYKLSSGSIGIAGSLSRIPKPDNYITETLRAEDFIYGEDNLYPELLRSHYVPLVDFAGTPFWDDTNFMTNMVARNRALNQGAWYGLEWAIRNLVNRGTEVYVLTGPIYETTPRSEQLPTQTPHRVPDAFYKIIMTERGQGSAFVFDQRTSVHVHHCELRSPVTAIEESTGLDFFPADAALPLGSLDSRLGCQ